MQTTLNTILIPEGLKLSREPNPKDHLGMDDLKKLDTKTLFYDVFVDQTGEQLIAIGPPAMNLFHYVRNAGLFINGKRKRFAFRDYPDHKLSILKANISPSKNHHIEISFKDFSSKFNICQNTAPTGERILSAISKNNEPEWVEAWADFHRHNYDIDEIIIYDNGSSNLDELTSAMNGKARIISWNFPYGPPGKRLNKFAQPGALNHCLRKYGLRGTLFNFDIDELLIADKLKLEQELDAQGTVYIDSHNVPRTQKLKAPYTHYDFTLRYPEKRKKARKFVCRESAVDIISQHNTWTRLKVPFLNKLHRAKPQKMESHHAYFLHFLAITTNWQPSLRKLDVVGEDNLTEDFSHIQKKPEGPAFP